MCHLFFQNETISVSWQMAHGNYSYLIIANVFTDEILPKGHFHRSLTL